MTPKIFRLGKFRRWSVLIMGIIAFGVLTWLMVMLFRLASSGSKLFPFLLPPFVGVVIFIVLLCSYMIWMVWSYRIEFGESELRVNRYGIPFARPLRCSYENIAYVRRPIMKGSIEVIPTQGKAFQFIVLVEGGSSAVMDEFEKHLSIDKFQVFLRDELKRYSQPGMLRYGFVVFMFCFLGLQWLPRMILPSVAWETIWGEGFLPSGHINNYWIEDQGTSWISFMRTGDTPQVVQINAKGTETWSFENKGDVLYANAIIADQAGQPWLIHDDFYLHWSGTSWQNIESGGYSIRANPPIVIDNGFWTIASRENEPSRFLLRIDLDDGKETLFTLPVDLAQDGFYIREVDIAPDNSIIVLFVKDQFPQAIFYSFQNGQWHRLCSLEVEWYVPDFELNLPDAKAYVQIDDFTIDAKGQIWVINDKDGRSTIGRYNTLKSEWDWSPIAPDCELCASHFSEMVVDKHDRVWATAGYSMKNDINDDNYWVQGFGLDVFAPHWGTSAERLVRYTNKNSNFQYGIGQTGVRLSHDGRIWIASDRLVWIDSNNPDLPKPMPDLFVKVTDPGNLLVGYLAGLVIMGILFFGGWVIKSFRNQGTYHP